MAVLTPARIEYFIGDVEQSIRFHAIISESHQASSEITKYPVQLGFLVSNHAIRRNRVVTIEAVISNKLLKGGATAYQYSLSSNTKSVFTMIEDLINNKRKATVTTNLGTYYPVIFNSFKTKQEAGMVDSMRLTISGEELIVAEDVNSTAPVPVTWVLLTPAESVAREIALNRAGFPTKVGAIFEEAVVYLGSNFSIESSDDLGISSIATYINTGWDAITNAYSYVVNTSDTGMFQDIKDTVANVVAQSTGFDITAGLEQVGDCLISGGADILEESTLDTINTAMGDLTRSIYGAKYRIMHMVDDEVGQQLLGMASGCVVRGVTGYEDQFQWKPGESLPSAEDILGAARRIGDSILEPTNNSTGAVSSPATLTRVSYTVKDNLL